MFNSPQAAGIQTSAGPLTPWLLGFPAFTPSSPAPFVIFLLLAHNTSLLCSPLYLSSHHQTHGRGTYTYEHVSTLQKVSLASREFFCLCFTWRDKRQQRQTDLLFAMQK
ncbi:hypothetical protein ILYODFUR_003894 [Ilyodon furcidens]|uniref:Uncharacterized protein n=1 Tax=Ilyodon furcidens TaxID=33524 RepID=A0ABV0T6F0_9TELE